MPPSIVYARATLLSEVVAYYVTNKRERFLQARDVDWIQIPFFAEYDENAVWLNELKPVGGGKFFFEEEMGSILKGRAEEDVPES